MEQASRCCSVARRRRKSATSSAKAAGTTRAAAAAARSFIPENCRSDAAPYDVSVVLLPSKFGVYSLLLAFAVICSTSALTTASCFVIQNQQLTRGGMAILKRRRALHYYEVTSSIEPTKDDGLPIAPRSKKGRKEIILPVRKVDEMPPLLSKNLKNKYYLLRHGQSTANVAEIISSSRSLAYTGMHGLTDEGYEQGKQSATRLLDALKDSGSCKSGDEVVFVSSPFARAYQTTIACLDGLEELSGRVKEMGIEICKDVVVHDNLVERNFGRLDGEAIYTYAYVWPLDKFDATHTAFDVESVAAVATRLHDLVEELEAKYDGCHLVWVSHADVLQIAQLYGSHADNVGLFSSYRFKNGEVRPMLIGTQSHLPPPVPLEAPRRGTYEYTLLTQ